MLTNTKELNNYRFEVVKSAHDFLKTNTLWQKDICSKEDFEFEYSWDQDFKKYFNIDTQKINEVWKYYNRVDLFLQNIIWENLYKNIWNTVQDILEKMTKNIKKDDINNLFIININSLEWVILWYILKEYGFNNVVFNLNKNINLNSDSKTFEAVLYIMAYKNSPYFRIENQKIATNLKKLDLFLKTEKSYIIIDQNNTDNNYNYLQIDDYIKQAIWYKESKNIYRLDKYPNSNFLKNKNIWNIVVFDNDNDPWKIIKFYEEKLKSENNNIKFFFEKYNLENISEIWNYENYLVKKSEEYKQYRNNILDKIEKNTTQTTPKEAKKWDNFKKIEEKVRDYTILPYIVMLPILIVAFFMTDLWINNSTSSTNSSWGWWYPVILWDFGWSSSYDNNSSSNVENKKSTSIIKSFGWWWFTKWSSSW